LFRHFRHAQGAAEQAVQEGLSPQEVKEAVQKAMDDLKEIGPERIASTELFVV